MIRDWHQRILNIDLSTGEITSQTVPIEDTIQFIGSRGVNAKILWQSTKAGIDPLGPDNQVIFGTGILTGTTVPSSGRVTVTCKSPATNRYLKTNGGGHWGAELRLAGWDYIIITGASPKPALLWINNDKIEIRPAGRFWGMGIKHSTEAIRDELGDSEIQLALIGPAGENKVMFADINLSTHHACGRGGAGAVMGSKNLKGIALRGTGAISVARPQEFFALAKEVTKAVHDDSSTLGRGMYGTSGGVIGTNETDTLPSYNYRQGHIEGAGNISGQNLVKSGYLTGRVACGACTTGCHRFVRDLNGPYGRVEGAGPEYETMAALGSNCGNTDVRAVMMANQLCNDLGMDTVSTGNVIGWAMESYENGVITKADTGGIELTWGNCEAIIETVKMIANRQGIGDVLANGVKRASEELGGSSWHWAIQSRGLEQSMVDTRGSKGYALAFAVNPRGPDHLFTEALAEYGETVEAQKLIEEITGDSKYADPLLTAKRAEIIRWHEDAYAATDSLGICVFLSTAAYGVNPANMARLFTLATGIEMSEEALMLAGRRVVTLEHYYNLREGASRLDAALPWRMVNEPQRNPMFRPWRNSQEEMDYMLDEYYGLHGWDKATTKPSEATLRRLGIRDLVGQGLKEQ